MRESITPFIQGYQKFRERHFSTQDTNFATLAREGQKPKALMIACSDSRVDPALVLDCQPGDLFVVRNVANLVPPYEEDQAYHGTSAALEFGVCGLGVRHVIVFGHTQCGGIQSLLTHAHEKLSPKSFLEKWMRLATPARTETLQRHSQKPFQEKVILCGQYSLIHSLKNLQTFPWIKERVEQGFLTLHAWNFDITQGVLEEYDEKQKRFKLASLP